MPMKITGVREARDALIAAAAKITLAAANKFNDGCEAMQIRAQELAPVDMGNVEESIKITKRALPPLPTRISRTIYIDEQVADIGEYAPWLLNGVYKADGMRETFVLDQALFDAAVRYQKRELEEFKNDL